LFFQQHGWQVSACDHEPQMLSFVQDNARQLGIEFPADRLRCEPVQRLSFDNAQFDAVICCAVLHFLPDLDAFHDALTGLVRVTKPGGIIIIRTVTATGIEKLIDYQEPGWYDLPDGSERLVLDHSFLLESFRQCGLALIEPLKSVVVHQARSMGTLVVQRTN
jgi:SAM-dependent methyltransferase